MPSWFLLVLPYWPWTATVHRRPSLCSRSLPWSSESEERKPVTWVAQITLRDMTTSYDICSFIVPEHSDITDTKACLPVWVFSRPDAPSLNDWGRTASVGLLVSHSDFWWYSFWKISFSLKAKMNNNTITRIIQAQWYHGTNHTIQLTSFKELNSGLAQLL